MSIAKTAFAYLVNHIFLPPKLPEGDDWEATNSMTLQSTLSACIEKFEAHVTHGNRALIRSAATMIRRMAQVQNENGYVHSDKLNQALTEIGQTVSGEAVPVHVVSQNAGVLISRHDDSIYIESFELSPLNSAVMESPGRLRRYFPGPAMAMNLKTFCDQEFQRSFEGVLQKLCHQSSPNTCPRVRKAGQSHDENRDTVDPLYVTEFMTAFLGPITTHEHTTEGVWKNTRGEVMWHKSYMPWRRSPVWLLIRVSLQLLFGHEAASTSQARCLYKSLMLFFTASLLMEGLLHQNLASDIIEIMRSKVARRKHKLLAAFHGQVDEEVTSFVDKTMTDAARKLINRQSRFLATESPHNSLHRLESVSFDSDTVHRLKRLDKFIKSISDRTLSLHRPSFCPPTYMPVFSKGSLPDLSGWSTYDTQDYTAFRLAEVEAWVAYHLDDWLSHAMSEEACFKLSDLMTAYERIAASFYSKSPEGRSIMVLVLIELWIACDKIAICQTPLLEQYDPCIPKGLFESFLLPFRVQMARLNRAEQYLEQRCRAADHLLPCVFSSFGDPQSFAVRFYNQSTDHQNLLFEIEAMAAEQRAAKIAELSNVQAEYRRLHNLFDAERCQYVELLNKRGRPYTVHSYSCIKCSYERQMGALNIRVHEWPLPRSKIDAQATVFEIRAPVTFSKWRDITIFILLNILKCQYDVAGIGKEEQSLGTYLALSRFWVPSHANQRIGLQSSTKSHTKTHRQTKAVPNLKVDDVCLHNGLNYHYFDSSCSDYVTKPVVTQDLPHLCTFKLPSESKVLEKYMFRPNLCPAGPAPNAAIANQAECPPHLSVEEYKGLCSIVAGNVIQWQNILLQLAMPSVNFRRAETGCMVLQAMYQAGPSDHEKTTLRQSHSILDCANFCAKLVAQLQLATRRIKQNWESASALVVFISAATRVLSLCGDAEVQISCFEFLAEARETAFSWLAKLRDKETSATLREPELELKARLAEIALICTATFDIEEPYFGRLLRDGESASILLQSCIAVQECLAQDKTNSLSALRWKRLCHRASRIFCRLIISGESNALDKAIGEAWPGYRGGTGWRPVSDCVSYWLETATESVCGRSLAVHFNLLTAELLVNGSPLSRLPKDWESHPTYRALFGNQILDVMPSDVPGMRFSAKQAMSGYVLHIGLQPISGLESPDLIISAKRLNVGQDASTYHLVPARVFSEKLPESFVTEHSHWYDDARKTVNFCPKSSPWEALGLGNGWTMSPFDGEKWKLNTLNHRLLSPLSPTAEAVGACLYPIEDIKYMHLMLEESSGMLKVELPRLGLGFRLGPGSTRMQSVQLRGMQVDSNQSMGSLGGLASKLLLTDKSGAKRTVIIPDGNVTWRGSRGHVTVDITKGIASRAHFYNIDRRLGRLQDNGSLRSKLYIAYLHGITSFAIPDPLTGCTGTEQALSILQSSAIKSMASNLSDDDVQLLSKIIRLTPSRRFYPRDLCVMQQVTWLPGLSFLSQHSHYYVEVMGILERAEMQDLFSTSSNTKNSRRNLVKRLDEAQDLDSRLLMRDRVNTAWVRVSGFGAEDFTTQHDRTYTSRDRARSDPGEHDCFSMSSAIYSGETVLTSEPGSDLQGRLWRLFKGFGTVLGSNHEWPSSHLAFNTDWLQHLPATFAQQWCWMHKALSCQRSNFNRFQLMSWFSAMAFAAKKDKHPAIQDPRLLQVLLAFALAPEMAEILPPSIARFNVAEGYQFDENATRATIRRFLRGFGRLSELDVPREPFETEEEYDERRQNRFEKRQSEAVEDFIKDLRGQWPCRQPGIAPQLPDESVTKYISIRSAGTHIAKQFHQWYDNLLFFRYLGDIARVTASQRVVTFPNFARSSSAIVPHRVWEDCTTREGFISVCQVFSQSQPPTVSSQSHHALDIPKTTKPASNNAHLPRGNFRIWDLVKRLEAQAVSDFQRRYARDLKESIQALQTMLSRPSGGLSGNDFARLRTELETYRASCISHMDGLLSVLEASVGIHGELASRAIRPLPRICPKFFLSQLTANRWRLLPDAWKGPIVDYGLAIHDVQRAERLLDLAFPERQNELAAELSDPGHSNWDPLELPLALLMEVETNITIRAIQIHIAMEMISPPGGQNAAMQLNMGEGKSSVIIPAIAAILASLRKILVRVIVGKPQSKQMFQMLVAKLGGLQNVVVHQLPFSRDLRLGVDDVATIARYLENCATTGGILLVQPEHILSFKLMGLECLVNSESAEMGQLFLETQRYYDLHSRDIVDESDENFSTKFELIYTMGIQRPVAFGPGRWMLLHHVLDAVRQVCPSLVLEMPRDIEFSDRHGPSSFPLLRILGGSEAQHRLACAVAQQICQTGLAGVPIARQAKASQVAVYTYLTEPKLSAEQIAQIEDADKCSLWTDTIKDSLLLLRGLLAGGILGFVLGQKRWRVNYGLDPERRPPTRLAVPYRAKDSPSPRSEFSHPEVVLLLTSFSYYYGGLSDEDLFHAFEHLLHSDQSSQEYQEWIRNIPDLSPALQHLEGINIKDRCQMTTQVFPALRYSKAAVDYFLGHIVFPRYMKEFPSKLSASGWDLGAVKPHPTTGFSGTKDSRELLPLSILHLDLKEQQHINALVIEYLLQDETGVMQLPSRKEMDSAKSDAEQLLTAVVNAYPEIQVVLDVGAQILELDNFEVAKQWLEMSNQAASFGGGHTKKQACVYLDDHDELRVVDLRGVIELLQTSPYAQQLDQCLVFLDEAHTRGTDLKLPICYRAAVTLGAALTKDRLIQACMRMRQLGKGQSILFCIPPEIQTKILQRRGTNRDTASTPIQVGEIIEWSIAETCIDLERCVALWAVQGKRFAHQQHLWSEITRDIKFSHGRNVPTRQWAEKFLEDEARTIQDLYHPGPRPPMLCCDQHADHDGIDIIDEHVSNFGSSVDMHSTTALQEEQERELSPEIEREIQIQRPHPANPARHSLDPEVLYFIRTGIIRKGAISLAFLPAFSTLSRTTAAAHLADLAEFPQDLLVTRDFARTIEIRDDGGGGTENKTDQFLRPVQWVVTSADGRTAGAVTTMVIISPFEAQNLIDKIKMHGRVVLHLYAPRLLLGFEPLDELRLYTTPALPDDWAVPSRLVLQLNLFSGQLYFASFMEYIAVCDMLGLDWKGCVGDQGQRVNVVGADGFVNPLFRTAETGCTFKHSPVGFLKVFLSKVRRDSKCIGRTHMGKMLDTVLLTDEEFAN